MMTSRQRVQTAIARKTPDRVPCASSLTEKDFTWLMETYNLQTKEAAERFMFSDFRAVYPTYIGTELTVSAKTGARMTPWGITEKNGDYALDGHPLADADEKAIDDYPYPMPEWYDLKAFRNPPQESKTYMIRCGEPFCLLGKAYDLMGMETVMINMFEKPSLLHRLLEKITESRYRMIESVLTAATWVDIILIMDELGTQMGPLIGPEQAREFIFPYHKQLAELIHAHHRLVYYHSCGSISPFVKSLVEIGVDILDNIQPTAASNDPYAFKREFGDHLVIQAQSDEINILPNWKPDAIYSHYRKIIEDLAEGGGFIFSPAFRSETTPKENVEALLRAVARPL